MSTASPAGTPTRRSPATPAEGAIDAHCHVFGPMAEFPSAPRRNTSRRCRAGWLFALRDISASRKNVIVRRVPWDDIRRPSTRSRPRRARRAASRWSIRHPRRRPADAARRRDARIRFNFLKRLVDDAPKDKFLEVAQRLPAGWHVVIYFEADILEELRGFMDAIPSRW